MAKIEHHMESMMTHTAARYGSSNVCGSGDQHTIYKHQHRHPQDISVPLDLHIHTTTSSSTPAAGIDNSNVDFPNEKRQRVGDENTESNTTAAESCHETSGDADSGSCRQTYTADPPADSEQPAASATADTEERIRKLTCSHCQHLITDEYIMRVANFSYHSACLRCTTCDLQLSEKCYYKHGKLYCTTDFNKEFTVSHCSGCHEPIEHSELIQKSGSLLYHLECFHCIVCGQQLNTGDEYYLLNDTNKLVCKMDFETAKTKGYDGSKRPRTTISAKQLEALKKAYKESNKPARHVRERLSLQTGLDMRVVQVWFQNRRAKEKRVNKEHKAGNINYDYMLDEMSFPTPSSATVSYPTHTAWSSVSSGVHVDHSSQYGASDTHPSAFVCAALTHGISYPNIASVPHFGGGSTVAFDYH